MRADGDELLPVRKEFDFIFIVEVKNAFGMRAFEPEGEQKFRGIRPSANGEDRQRGLIEEVEDFCGQIFVNDVAIEGANSAGLYADSVIFDLLPSFYFLISRAVYSPFGEAGDFSLMVIERGDLTQAFKSRVRRDGRGRIAHNRQEIVS